MVKNITILLLIIFPTSGKCYTKEKVDLDILKIIESGGNRYAYNKKTKARGAYQITPICLKDFNNLNNKKYLLRDMYNEKKCKEVCIWYLNKRIPTLLRNYGHEITLENVLRAYNNGAKRIGVVERKETRDYIKKYKRLTRGNK